MSIIVVKALEKCNASCPYCYNNKQNRSIISLQTIRNILFQINDYLKQHSEDFVEIQWHGGEPLLLGMKFFMEVNNMQKEILGTNLPKIFHSMQSNLTSLNKSYFKLLKEMGLVTLGTSYEPLPAIRGIGKQNDWRRYNTNFLKSVTIIDSEKMKWGLIYVVTKKSLPHALTIYQNLININTNGILSIVPVITENTEFALDAKYYIAFLNEIYPQWYTRHRQLYPGVEPFASFTKLAEHCSTSIEVENRIVIDAQGNVFEPRNEMKSYGNISEQSLQYYFSVTSNEALAYNKTLRDDNLCESCVCKTMCLGEDAFTIPSKNAWNTWCEARRNFLTNCVKPTILAENVN
jgi:uncharacterized protein